MSRIRLRTHISPSLVISIIALVVALSGVAYATTALRVGSVGTPQLRNSAVTNAKLGRNSVTSSKVAPHSLAENDLAAGVVPQATSASANFDYARDNGPNSVGLPSDGSPATVIDLSSSQGQRTGKLVLSRPAHVTVAFSVYLQNADVQVARSLRCQAWSIAQPSGSPQPIGFETSNLMAPAEVTTISQTTTTGAALAAGSYDIRIRCATPNAAAGGRLFYAELTAWALR